MTILPPTTVQHLYSKAISAYLAGQDITDEQAQSVALALCPSRASAMFVFALSGATAVTDDAWPSQHLIDEIRQLPDSPGAHALLGYVLDHIARSSVPRWRG